MDGRFVPAGWGALEPRWRNLFENDAAVQFDHRLLGYIFAAAALIVAAIRWRASRWRDTDRWALLVLVLVGTQIWLGIATLVLVVPVGLALMHQGLAFVIAGSIAAWLADVIRVR
jgi:cytochrome c oxidase assembly protein subunit 15